MNYPEGVIGFEGPAPGQQTGHIVTAGTPSWGGFIQCNTCRLPRQYDEDTARRRFRVDELGEISCLNCIRRRYLAARRWYPANLRVFQPGPGEGDLPRRVIPVGVFSEACNRYPGSGRAGLRNAFLLGYAYQVIDGQEGALGRLYSGALTPWGSVHRTFGGGRALAIAFGRGRGYSYMTDGGRQ